MSFEYIDLIEGDYINLIPYKAEHVIEYHQWLQSPEIIELTETEACSLEEEIIYQQEWELDNQKTKLIKLIQIKDTKVLIGDINLFFSPDGDCEINLMIANHLYRGKGYAKEGLNLIISYLRVSDSNHRRFKRIIAKILSKNRESIRFFEKFGFKQDGPENVFNELCYIYDL